MATYPVGASKTYTTIQAAITAAGAAQDYDAQIPVDAGTYPGDFTLATRIPGFWAMPIHLYAADPDNRPVIIPGSGGYGVTGDIQHADAGTRVPVFRNLIWSGGSNTNALVNGSGGTPMHFIGCDFLTPPKIVFRFANAGTSHARRWEIRRCRFDPPTGGETISAGLAGYGLIESCRFRYTVNTYGIALCATVSNWLAYNNSVYSTATGGTLFQLRDAYNNAIEIGSGNPTKLFNCNGTYDYNVFNWAGTNTGTNGGHNNASGIPGFTSPSTGDFSITTASPCYNTGTTLADVTIDYLETARPQDGFYDVGAFEYVNLVYSAWNTGSGETYPKVSSSFVINKYLNLSQTYSLRSGLNAANGLTVVEQAPFSLGSSGPISLRLRTKAYILVPEGHNPSTQAGTPLTSSV